MLELNLKMSSRVIFFPVQSNQNLIMIISNHVKDNLVIKINFFAGSCGYLCVIV